MVGLPSLTDLLNAMAFLGELPAAWCTLATALLLIVLRDWRYLLLVLAVQYVLVGWLLTDALEPQVAVLKILVGLITCLVLYLTARQVDWGRWSGNNRSDVEGESGRRRRISISFTFRLLIGLLTSIAILNAVNSQSINLPELPFHTNLAAFALMTMGLLALGLTEEPLTAGMGLLTILSGFELFFHSVEQALTVIGFMIGIDFLVAIITAYLTVARHWTTDEAERRRLL